MKIIALIIGPIGYGIIFQFYNFFSLFTSSVHLGTPVGLIANNPENRNKSEFIKGDQENYFIYYIRLFGIVSLTLTILIVYFSDVFSSFLVGEVKDNTAFIILIMGAPFGVLYAFFDAYLKNKSLLDQMVKITIISSLVSLVFLYPLLKWWNINGASVFFMISAILPVSIFAVYNSGFIKNIFYESIRTQSKDRGYILKIGSVSLLSSFMYLGSFIMLRKFVIDNFGLMDNGIFQSVVTLANSSFLIVFSFLSSFLLPKLSKIESNAEIAKELDIGFRFVIFMVIPILICVYLGRTTIISLVYTSEFLKASDLIIYQFIGECFKCFSALFGLWMISKMKIKYIMSFDFIMNLFLISIPFGFKYFFHEVKLELLPIAYMLAFFIHFCLYIGYTVKCLKYRLSALTLRSIIFSIAAMLICFSVSNLQAIYQLAIAPVLIFTYLFTSFSKRERYKMFSTFRNTFKF